MATAFDVETVEGFVEKKDVSFLRQSTGDKGALLLAAGKLVDLAVCNVAKIHRGDGLLGFFLIDFFEPAEVADVGETSHCDDIADPNGKVALMAIDLGKVGDLLTKSR